MISYGNEAPVATSAIGAVEQDKALQLLSCPTTGARLFGARARSGSDIPLIVPDNDILGSVLARRVRRMMRLPSEDISLTANFCQAPRPDRFSIVAYHRETIKQVAAFATLSWRMEHDIDIDEDAEPDAYTLTVHVETLFVDARLRGEGYARALQDAAIFWSHNLLIDLDRKLRDRSFKPDDEPRDTCTLDVVLSADASASFDLEILRRFGSEMREGIQNITEKRNLSTFRRIELLADITHAGQSLEI